MSSSGINIGTWNVRTLRTEGHWEILLDEVRRFGLDILGLCETHLTESETLINKDEYTILLAGRKDGIGREGVGLLISQPLLECLVSYESVSSRILTAKFKMKDGILNIINVYAPTTTHSDAESDEFYDGLQHHLQKVNKKEKLILMGNFNAKIGLDTPAMGKYGIGQINSRGEKLLEFCMLHKLTVCNTHFQHKAIRS
ncbi:craniofacial development protein 2-like [Amphiura filiformis]|uniref:craniofacial development protein 2-like n=1 Tax=Amphiura filiformis TaxID=82378 RepID=UPI003B21E786